MSNGIAIPPSQPQPQQTQAAPELAKVVSVPPDLPTNKPISGEVVSNDKGIVTIKTDQGLVVVEADIDAAAGQKINLRLQNVVQQTKQIMIAELLNTFSDKTIPTKTALSVMPDNVLVNTAKPLAEFTPLQARLVSLPDVLGDEAIQVMVKSLLKLPSLAELPQTLKEGFAKFQQLTQLMGQANLLPGNALQSSGQQGDIPKGLLTAMQQLFNPAGKQQSPLLAQPGQNFIQLQTILPGQTISPNILLNVRQQLLTVLQPQAQQQTQEPLFTMPAMGLVLGLQPKELPGVKNANLVFMATPQGQQLIGLLSPQAADKPLLPGTVLVMAFEPQLQKTVALPVLPSSLLAEDLTNLKPLNLSLGDTWPALKELVEQAAAQQIAQPELMNALRQVLPTPNPQHMPAALLFFMAVLKNGFTEQWLPEGALKDLEKIGKTELLKQLGNDLRLLQSSLSDNVPADRWQPLPIPLQVGDQLLRLQFFYRYPDDALQRQSDEKDKQNEKRRKTRFLLNVPKTSFGDIQIDGLVQEKDLEMILRTENPMTSQIEGAIRERYQSVLETTGMNGGINFQSGHQHFVRA